MDHVISRDGTKIALTREGAGPGVVLVGGGLDDGAENAPLAAVLAQRFTVVNYARRGRGASSDTPPYAVEREVEDLAAVIGAAGGAAHVFGTSSGGALVLEAAASGLPITSIAVYEVPFDMGEDWPRLWRAYVERVTLAVAENRRADAVELFMRLAETPDEEIVGLRASPWWENLLALAPSLAQDAACLGTGQPRRLGEITQPALVLTGDARDPAAPRWIRALDPAADALVAGIAGARRGTLAGQPHTPDPDVLAAALAEHFTS
ncbi:alpha/beta fold hydrolase [Allokutzneria sp. NRRL B-24872]|uniref:alpha/beta fold hydrolase n=1 Tax=Allokutzneria sp. NRRL B-24872 TaxID=1137961 RepID=UPI000A38BEDF|nr:alpha/beta hydrolase [Allokutzneria sp. NRRL B-24872]